jgi:adhesin transport system outer membrane protein
MKKCSIKLRFATVPAAAALLCAGAAFGATLPQVTEKAILQSPDVQARYRNFLAAAAEQDVARGGFLPRLNLQASAGREHIETPAAGSRNFSHPGAALELRQLIFDGFVTGNDVRRLGYAKLARYYELLGTTDDIAFETARAYLDVQRYRELSQLAVQNWGVHREIFGQIEQRASSGVGRRVDLEQAGGRLALARSNWLTETGNLHDVSARFERIVGESPPAQLDPIPATNALPAEKEVLALAVRDNPAFQGAVANIRAAYADVAARRGAYAPTVELQATHGTERDQLGVPGTYRNSSVRLVLNYNIFNGGADQARIRQSAEQRYAAMDVRDRICRDVRQTTAIAYNEMRRLREQIQYLEQHQLATAKARDAYRQQFDIGQRSLLDVLDTENELFEARRALVRAQYDMRVAEFRVLSQAHRVLPALQLAQLAKEPPAEAGQVEAPDEAAVRCGTELAPLPTFDEAAAISARPVPGSSR